MSCVDRCRACTRGETRHLKYCYNPRFKTRFHTQLFAMTSVGGGAALHYMMPMHHHEPDFPDPYEPVAPEVDDKEAQEGTEDHVNNQLNLSYTVKPPKPRPGGYAERLEVSDIATNFAAHNVPPQNITTHQKPTRLLNFVLSVCRK